VKCFAKGIVHEELEILFLPVSIPYNFLSFFLFLWNTKRDAGQNVAAVFIYNESILLPGAAKKHHKSGPYPTSSKATQWVSLQSLLSNLISFVKPSHFQTKHLLVSVAIHVANLKMS